MLLDRVIAVRNTKTVYRDGDMCYKVFNSEYTKASVMNEALNQARIEELDLNIPEILEVTRIDGKWCIISEYIKGKSLDQIMHENPEKTDECLNMFVDLQLEVLKKSCNRLGRIKDKLFANINAASITVPVRKKLLRMLDELPAEDNLCHGDFIPTNIIIDNERVPYILDWSHAIQGSPASDAASTYLLFELAEEHENAEKYVELFCKKSGTDRSEIEKWLPLIAASQSVRANARIRAFYLERVNRKERI